MMIIYFIYNIYFFFQKRIKNQMWQKKVTFKILKILFINVYKRKLIKNMNINVNILKIYKKLNFENKVCTYSRKEKKINVFL